MSKSRSKSSKEWLNRQHKDLFVKRAAQAGYRSRSAFKLLEIQERDKLFKPGMTVVDLGAAPGGWSQVAVDLLRGSSATINGKIIALDILPIVPIEGVDIIQGDFREPEVHEKLLELLGGSKIDLVISDMAPNFSGIGSSDVLRAVYLAEIALEFAKEVLEPNGSFLVKLFQGEGFIEYMQLFKHTFKTVVTRKPKASRAESREVYLLGRGVI
jgi:23S rRNA (uridine2552-2'-O)-methyltransferase